MRQAQRLTYTMSTLQASPMILYHELWAEQLRQRLGGRRRRHLGYKISNIVDIRTSHCIDVEISAIYVRVPPNCIR
jgi:hypothetical protein